MLSIRFGLFGWRIQGAGGRTGKLAIPIIRRIFSNLGNAKLFYDSRVYEVTYPMRLAGELGEKEVPVRLIEAGNIVATIYVSGDLPDRFVLTWHGRHFDVLGDANSWKLLSEGRLLYLGKSRDSYSVLDVTSGDLALVPEPVLIAVAWTLRNPIRLI